MIGWYQIIAYSITDGIRIFMCFFLIAILLKLERPSKSMIWLSLICGMAIELLSLSPLPKIGTIAFEVLAILFALYWKYQYKSRMCVFLSVCIEIATALWDFLFCAGFEILFQYSTLNGMLQKYIVPIWAVRLLMIVFMLLVAPRDDRADKLLNQFSSVLAVAGMFCVLILSEQSAIPLPDDQLFTWTVFSVVLLVAVLFYRVNRQYEMEKEIVRLKTEQAELIKRDFQNLNRAYSANATLYHDLHNHLEALYSYISNGQTEYALNYIEDLRTPVGKIACSIWTGDEAVDYLISSKISAADRSGIKTKVNIEFPQHTNIKSVDLTTILGNLLDNALEAIIRSKREQPFLYLTIRRINDMLIIKVENSYTQEPFSAGLELKTTKGNSALHGWGLKSARAVAEQYDGTLELAHENGVFCAVATLCFEAIS